MNTEDLKKLHAIWQIGSDDAAADAVDDIMEALPELLERVRRLERALQAIAKEQSATTATEAADRMQFIARAALKEPNQ